jgi:hypothetical protein
MTASASQEPAFARAREFDLFGSLRRRMIVSIAATVGWLSLILLFLAFWTRGFSIFQDIVVVVVSLVILMGTLLATWISFGLRFVGRWDH